MPSESRFLDYKHMKDYYCSYNDAEENEVYIFYMLVEVRVDTVERHAAVCYLRKAEHVGYLAVDVQDTFVRREYPWKTSSLEGCSKA